MTKTEVRLAYQKEFGGPLDSINIMADNHAPELQAYIDWLEEKVISLAKHNQHLLDSTQPHLY